MTSKVSFKKQLNDLSELKDLGLYIIEDDVATVENNLQEILKEKGLLISDLSKLTGISRQNINAVIRNKMKPSIEFVLKVSFVLGIKDIDGIFSLSEDAWVKPYRQERDATVYLNVVELTMVNTIEKSKEIKNTGYEFYNVETGELLTKKQYSEIQSEFFDKEVVAKRIQSIRQETLNELKESGELEEMIEELREKQKDAVEAKLIDKAINSVLSTNQMKSRATEELREEFNSKYSKIYKKLGRRIEPYVVK